jgi:hypothetical protein
VQVAARGSEGGVRMQAKERRSTQPEAPAAATGGSRMVTFDLPPAAAQTPAQPSTDASSVSTSSSSAAATAAAKVSSDKGKQSSSNSPTAKKPSVPPTAPHSTAAAKQRTQRAVGKVAGLSPRGLVPSKENQEAQQQAAKAASVTVGRVCFPA